MSTRVLVPAALALGIGLPSGCSAEPPSALHHLPRDAAAIWGVDLGALAAWPGLEAPGPLASLHAPQLRDGLVACGLQPAGLAAVGAGRTAEGFVAVLSGPGVGSASTLRCVGEARWRGEGKPPWWTIDDDGRLSDEGGDTFGRVIDGDTLVIAGDPSVLDAAHAGDDAPWPAEVRAAMADVDFGAPAWAVAVPSSATSDLLADAQSAALTVTLGEGLALRAVLRTADEGASERVAAELDAALREVAGWIYASPTLVDRADVTRAEERVELALALPLSQWQGLDLRFLDERRGLIAPPALGEDDEPEATPLLARLSLADAEPAKHEPPPEPVPVAEAVPGPTGVAACDEYLSKYRRCVEDHLPEAAREVTLEALDKSGEAWKAAASTPAGRSGLEIACQTASEAASEATRAMGCTW